MSKLELGNNIKVKEIRWHKTPQMEVYYAPLCYRKDLTTDGLNDKNCVVLGYIYYYPNENIRELKVDNNCINSTLRGFDNELDIEFIQDYIEGMKTDWESSKLSLKDYCYGFGNELCFPWLYHVPVVSCV